jgi:FtsX-like permease family protein
MQPGVTDDMRRGRLSLRSLAWHHLRSERASSAGVALALVLALLPAGLLVVESSGAGSDLRTALGASAGLTATLAKVETSQAFDSFQQQARAQVEPTMGQYLDGGSPRLTAGPYRASSINANPPAAPLDGTPFDVAYVADLAAHVDVREGLLAKPAASGGERTASMPIAMADRAGIRLFDLVCIGVPSQPNPADWCVRVTGLWRPTTGADPGWTAPGARLQLFTDRDQLFALIGLRTPLTTEAARQYRPRAAAIGQQDIATVEARVAELRAAAGAATVTSALDADLQRYTAARRVASFPLRLLTVALIPLSALLGVVLARWYVEARLHDLALLRARGWSRSRVQRLVLVEFALVGVSALAVGVVGLLALAWWAGRGTIAVGPLLPNQLDPLGVGPAALIPVATAVVWCGWLARWAADQSVLRLDHPEARASRVLSWPVADSGGLLVLPAALLLLLPRLVGTQRWLASGSLADLAALLLSVAGLAMLAVAALPALSLITEAPGRRRTDVQGTLAQWRLRRWWQRHSAAGFLMVFAFAVAAFAAVAFADQVLVRMGADQGVVGQGDAGGLAVGFACSLAMAILAFGLVFLFAARARVDDYTALLVDGLPVTAVRHSLDIEQRTVLLPGLLIGLVLGLALALATSAGIGLGGTAGTLASGRTPAAAILGLLMTIAIALPAGLLVARFVRQRTVDYQLFQRGQRAR